MDTAELIGRDVRADAAVVGDDFLERLSRRLDGALAASGKRLPDFAPEDSWEDMGSPLSSDPFIVQYDGLLEDMEAHLCLSDDYPIPSHRLGVTGAFARLVKRAVLFLKLRADVQVSQQARFNLASFVGTQLSAAQLELIAGALRAFRAEYRKRSAEQDALIASLKQEVAELRGKIDGR